MNDTNVYSIQDVITYNKSRKKAFVNNLPFERDLDIEKILNSRNHKVIRIKKRLLYLIIRYKNIWFCTFTINNNYINKCERTKRDYLKQYLNTHDFKYILNVDFGQRGTERQHYHCILATNLDIDINQYFQSYLNIDFGWTKSLKCLTSSSDISRITKYIDKLSNHCVKASTQQKRILYNFKGYDNFCKSSHDITLQYKLEFYYHNLISCVPLLDKGDITGNFGG